MLELIYFHCDPNLIHHIDSFPKNKLSNFLFQIVIIEKYEIIINLLESTIEWSSPQPIEIILSSIDMMDGINSLFVVFPNPNSPYILLPHE